MLRYIWLLLLPCAALAQEEWDNFDLTDGFGPGALIESARTEETGEASATNPRMRVQGAQFSADTTPFDVTWSGAGSPVAVAVFATTATSTDTTVANGVLGCGFSDFTTTAATSLFDDDNVGTSDGRKAHDTGSIVYLVDENGSEDRTATVATITDGVRFTPGESGNQRRIIVIGFYDTDAYVFSTGDGTAQDSTFSVTHGLGTAPGLGIFCHSAAVDTNDGHAAMSIGVTDGTSQFAYGVRWREGQADGTQYARLLNNAVAMNVNNSGGTFQEAELTGNTDTQTTFTAREGSFTGDLVGLLLPADSYSVDVDTLTRPSGSTWNNTDPGFSVGGAFIVMAQATAVDSAINDDPAAGTISVFATDMDTEVSVSAMSENAAATTNTASRYSTEMWMGDDDQTEAYACNGFDSAASGFDANCDTTDATAHLFIAVSVEEFSSSVADSVRRRRQ